MSHDRRDLFVFEVSWEAARRVGGIYTVLKSKAKFETTHGAAIGSDYCLIGPMFVDRENLQDTTEFEFITPVGVYRDAIETFQNQQNADVYFGRWLIDGYPKIIMLDVSKLLHRLPG
jgi:glycogen(starch) synthase